MASRVVSGVGLIAATVLSAVALPVAVSLSAVAAVAAPTAHGIVTGQLGLEGGPYPGGFHATAGIVKFADGPQKLRPVKVPDSGDFTVHVVPGGYTLTGCSGTKDSQCGRPQDVTVKAGATSHVQVVWLLAP